MLCVVTVTLCAFQLREFMTHFAKGNVQGIHKRMARFQFPIQLKPHHSFVYALYNAVAGVEENFNLERNYYSCANKCCRMH
jgi:hypothetical protein